ncbi:DUF1611 domain-containing protein [Citricoccus muralis]|uniref:DUF1611 domain-containing protein n=1 Tax=Citricoccus muralis TaxID=169134 RepID=A0ABY8H8T2_9MICC|nr:DUF1611 domain-containing protein [Citricoccus muralis]WFP17573.1 DUF1611 domain-containing protein [Citricoccus muralis]
MTASLTSSIASLPAPLSAEELLRSASPLNQLSIVRHPVPARVQGSYTTRFAAADLAARPDAFHLLSGNGMRPMTGDVVVARVVEIGNHKRVETMESRKAILFENSIIMLAYGHRYAADQFLAHVPDSLQPCHLVAAGGIAGLVTESHADMEEPTLIEPLGLLADEHGVVNVARSAPLHFDDAAALERLRVSRPKVIAVLGTSMNSGKSTAAACLVNGLTASDRRVAAGKITGTGAGNDPMHYHDAGAQKVLDFTDFGYPTTFKTSMPEVRSLTVNLIDRLADSASGSVDVVIVEIADGVYQEETAALLRDPLFHEVVDQVVFTASDALGAQAGVQALQNVGLSVAAASGVMTSSPLATREAGQVLSGAGVPVINTLELTDPEVATRLLLNEQA